MNDLIGNSDLLYQDYYLFFVLIKNVLHLNFPKEKNNLYFVMPF